MHVFSSTQSTSSRVLISNNNCNVGNAANMLPAKPLSIRHEYNLFIC